jgi:sigma-B regulation protein RsbU (phosphoserine phosphatase)
MTDHEPYTILLVEDSPVERALTAQYLKQGLPEAHVLYTASRLGEAIARLSTEHVDLVLLDLGLPDSTGVATLTRLHGEVPAVPIVVLSGIEEREVALQAVREGAHDYVLKGRVTADALARIIRFAIERQKRMDFERELRAAEDVQANLFPATPPGVAGLDIAGAAHSAGNACGDYYDFLDLPTGEIGLVVGDVSGHGMAAALRMVEVRAYLRSLVRHTIDLGGILTGLNRFMIHESAYGSDGFQQFVTLFFAAIDRHDFTMRYASAGHPAYIVHDSGRSTHLASTGVALGIVDVDIEPGPTLCLDAGDTLVIPTDGIEESMAFDGTRFGTARLLSLVHEHRRDPASTILERLYAEARSFSSVDVQLDDMTAVIVRAASPRTRLGPERLLPRNEYTIPASRHPGPHQDVQAAVNQPVYSPCR